MAQEPQAEDRSEGRQLSRMDLLARYRDAVRKYDELLRRYTEDSSERSSAVTLALAALRVSRSGLALFGKRGFLNRNDEWLALARQAEPWRNADGPNDAAHASLESAAEQLARPLLTRKPDVPMRLARFLRSSPEQIVELRLEAVLARDQPLVIAIAEDVTERVRADRELARTRETAAARDRMGLLGELASGVAHDLNNTLHALSLRIGHLQSTDLDEGQRENVDVLARIVTDAAERVSRLQELGRRREDVPTESFDVGAVAREALAVARPDIEERAHVAGISFQIETDLPEGVRVVGSAAELRHVFVNLLLNARDATPRGGKIRISCRRAGTWAEVRVEDEGVGIPAEHLDRIFDPFFTTKGPFGTGLGLAIAQGVMRRLGGNILASNGEEGGAVFKLTFPVADERLEGAALSAAPRRAGPGHRLLVVDDDQDNLDAISWVLKDLGQEVDTAASGSEAVELLSSGRRYDLILCDVGMPNMNGWQVAEHVRRIARGARFLLLTGWAQEIPLNDPKRRLVDGILAKPLDIARLRAVLDERLGEPVAQTQGT